MKITSFYRHRSILHLAIASVALPVCAQVTNMVKELEEDHELSMEFETPHTDWAQPYAQPPARVMYFGYGGSDRGIEARDLVELKQRFDLEAEAAFFQRMPDKQFFSWIGGEAGGARLERLVSEQEWDCFLFNGIPPDLMLAYRMIRDKFSVAYYGADDAERELHKAGMVLIGVNDPHLTKEKYRIAEEDSPVPEADAFENPYGRVVRLPPRPKIDFHPGWEIEYDHWMERVGRAVLWASGREPRVALGIQSPKIPLDRTDIGGAGIQLHWTSPSPLDNLAFSARLRSAEGTIIDLPLDIPQAGKNQIGVHIQAPLRAGKYHLDAFATSDKGIESWVTRQIEFTSSRIVSSVQLDSEWGENGDVIAGKTRLTGNTLANEKVLVRLKDVHGRIVNQTIVTPENSEASFSFTVEPWMPMLLEVRGLLTSNDEEISSNYAYFHAVRRHRNQFNFVVWTPGGAFSAADWPYDTLAPYVHQQLARLGCTVQLSGSRGSWRGWPFLPVAAANISLVPYATRITTSWDERGFMTIPHTEAGCWNNQEAIQDWIELNTRKCQGIRQHGVFVYGLGDEGASSGSCVHPLCLDAYRRYLEEVYGDIVQLNESWDEDYASFEQVNLLVPGDNEEEEALRRGLKPRWYDRQAYQAYNLVHYAKKYADGFKRLDPKAISGYEGSGRFADGADIDLVCRTMGYWAPYPGLQDEVLRSIIPTDFIYSNWMGHWKGTGDLLGQYWRMLTLGFDSVWFWRWSGLGPYEANISYHGLINGAMVPFRAVKELLADTQVIRDGLGTLLQGCHREDDGIAMLYSYPSQFAISTGPGISYGDAEGHEMSPLKDHPNRDGKESLIVYEKNHISWHRSLRATGLNFSYVTDRMLRLGEFHAEKYKVLILSQIEALGKVEAEIIRAFVEGGGMVIADVRPGVYDGHCKPTRPGYLDDLFGIRRVGDMHASITNVHIDGSLGNHTVQVSLSGLKVDPGVEVTEGTPLARTGNTPLCIVNRVGKGMAMLLNFSMDSYPVINTDEIPPGATDFIRAMLAAGNVKPEISLFNVQGTPVRDTEIVRWKGPGVDFISLFGGMSLAGRRIMYIAKDEQVLVGLPEARHVYDLRENTYLGEVSQFETTKLGNRATFLVLSEHALDPPNLASVGGRLGHRIAIDISYPGQKATHAVRLTAEHPNGMKAEWHEQVIIVHSGRTQAILPVAINDPVGSWTIAAKDLYTGETSLLPLSVRP